MPAVGIGSIVVLGQVLVLAVLYRYVRRRSEAGELPFRAYTAVYVVATAMIGAGFLASFLTIGGFEPFGPMNSPTVSDAGVDAIAIGVTLLFGSFVFRRVLKRLGSNER